VAALPAATMPYRLAVALELDFSARLKAEFVAHLLRDDHLAFRAYTLSHTGEV
jgi:hypothetical protein